MEVLICIFYHVCTEIIQFLLISSTVLPPCVLRMRSFFYLFQVQSFSILLLTPYYLYNNKSCIWHGISGNPNCLRYLYRSHFFSDFRHFLGSLSKPNFDQDKMKCISKYGLWKNLSIWDLIAPGVRVLSSIFETYTLYWNLFISIYKGRSIYSQSWVFSSDTWMIPLIVVLLYHQTLSTLICSNVPRKSTFRVAWKSQVYIVLEPMWSINRTNQASHTW